jgi:two-component system chemotaxis response regulator CheY
MTMERQGFADDFMAEMKVRRVLIADDYVAIRATMYRLLVRSGWEDVVQADNGATALTHLAEPGIGAVLSDFRMARLNGLQLLQQIRSGRTAAPRNLPVLLVTGHADHDLIKRARLLDVNGIIVKPFSAAALADHLTKAFCNPMVAKAIEHYAGVEVPIEPDEVPLAGPAAPTPRLNFTTPSRPGVLTVAALRPGMKLDEDVRSDNGVMLVVAGAPLTEHMVDRLRELSRDRPDLRSVRIQK